MYMHIARVAIRHGWRSRSPMLSLAERQKRSILWPLEELHSGAVCASILDLATQAQGGMLDPQVARDDLWADA